MRKIYTLGETVYDIVFKNGHPTGGNPGGSVLNSSVSLGRLGLNPIFMSDFCNDLIGGEIANFLEQNGVNTQSVVSGTGKQTSVALAFLDSNNNAKYEFYKQRYISPDLSLFAADFQENDILLFGSFYGIMPEIRNGVRNLVQQARQKGAIVVYDPNFRRPHLKDLDIVKPFMEENFAMADVVKGSNEDFELIYGSSNSGEVFEILTSLNKGVVFFYTMGKDGCIYHHKGVTKKYNVPPINPVSTIGAGDNFNAGIVYGIVENNILRNDIYSDISNDVVDSIVNYAVEFSQEACMSSENYIHQRHKAI